MATTREGRKRRSVKARPAKARARKKVTRKTSTRKQKPKTSSNATELALAAFAHEVRTPLTGILAISSLLATSDLGEREARWVETIKTGAEHLAALATLIVDGAKRHAGNLVLRNDLFDLVALARAAGDSLSGRAASRGLQADIAIADDLPQYANGDAVRLRAALENLIDNAAKFTDRGMVSLSVSSQNAPKSRLKVSFQVADSGIGLSPAEIKSLFSPFAQANAEVAMRFGGAGLGLSSARQLARAMGGDVTAARRKEGGTVFTLTALLKRASVGLQVETSSGTLASFKRLRILSVEDNPFGRVVLNAMLTELGHTAQFAERGEDAPKRVASGAFDVVLMDMVLPGIGGVETIRRIRALDSAQREIPIVGVSGQSDDETQARKAGADAFVLKPVSPRALATALLEATRRAAAAT